jgi:acyl transferase domain-containing protein/acyl carrier protein
LRAAGSHPRKVQHTDEATMSNPPDSTDLRELFRRSLRKISELQAELKQREHASSESIAIVGLGCRYPSGISHPDQFWQLLVQGGSVIREIPEERWDIDAYYDPDPDAPGKMYSRFAGVLEDVDLFDAAFFGISPREANNLDPQQRLLLEVSFQALEHAGLPPDRLMGVQGGVFMAVCTYDYGIGLCYSGDVQIIDAYSGTGISASVAAGRISYLLGLRGPCITLDTACSSSLVATHLACESLLRGECELSLVGGVSLILLPEGTVYFCRIKALAPDGKCKAFDAAANGYVRGDGCAVLVLKRLRDALRDNDRIQAVVRGTAINQDGRSNGLTAPNGPAQEDVIRKALARASVRPSEVDYVEAHGTGTALGDPIEIRALGAALADGRSRDHRLLVGSVKTNVGHTEGAAGVTGILKTVLALNHEELPPSLNFQIPSPLIPWDRLPVRVVTERQPWKRNGHPRTAGVSSFGFSGTNAHVVLSELPPELAPREPEAPAEPTSAVVLPISARSSRALGNLVDAYREMLARTDEERSEPLRDIIYTAGCRRSHYKHRAAVVGQTRAELLAGLLAFSHGAAHPNLAVGKRASSSQPKVVFVFPGQGSQWVGMGRQLLSEEPAFRAAFTACEKAIFAETGWSVLQEIEAGPERSRLGRASVVQPLLFAVSAALAALWRAWGVAPAAVIGHSLGEVTAAYVAGALSLSDAARVICRRSALVCEVSGRGGMAVVELGKEELLPWLAPYGERLSVAAFNGPCTTVVAGETEALAELLPALEAGQVFCRRINVDYASHSPQMDALRDRLLEQLGPLRSQAGVVPILSTVSGQWTDGAGFDAAYWADNLRQPVRFAQGIERLMGERFRVFLELSPHPVLLSSIEACSKHRTEPKVALPSLRRDQPERLSLLQTLARLYTYGCPIDWSRSHERGRCVSVPLYPWDKERFWIDLGRRASRRGRGAHPLLGETFSSSLHPEIRFYEGPVGPGSLPYLASHRVQGVVVLPAAAYLEAGLAAGKAAPGASQVVLEDVSFLEAMIFDNGKDRALQTTVTEEQPGLSTFCIASRPASESEPWVRHAKGRIRAVEEPPRATPVDLAQLQTRLGDEVSADAYYQALTEAGLNYGPRFRGVQSVRARAGEALGRITLPEGTTPGHYTIHPVLLDAAFQVAAAAIASLGRSQKGLHVPVGLRALRVHGRPAGSLWCHATAHAAPDNDREHLVDLTLLDAEGRVLALALALRARALEQTQSQAQARQPWLLSMAFRPVAITTALVSSISPWIVIQDSAGVGDALCRALEAREASVITLTAGPRQQLADALRRVAPDGCRGVVYLGALSASEPLVAAALQGVVRPWEEALQLFQAVLDVRWRSAPTLWVVTRGAQLVGQGDPPPSPVHAALWGLSRCAAVEHPEFGYRRVDLGFFDPDVCGDALVAELLAGNEAEVALRAQGRFVGRLVRAVPSEDVEEPVAGGPFKIEMRAPGVLARLEVRRCERRAPGPLEVEIEVEAAGLNFIDVMKALGVYPGQEHEPIQLGMECAGRVSRMGPGVTGLSLGQPVLALGAGCLASHVLVDARFVLPRPAGLSAEQAAAVVVAFATAWYALYDLAGLSEGERVLIHAAAGGTGQAALQLSRRVGARVWATAGSEQKRALLRAQGAEHVFDSRSVQFAEQVLSASDGQGVEVVLNSLSGKAMVKSMEVAAADGRFIELGKRDLYGGSPLPLEPLRRNVRYASVDLVGLAKRRPERVRQLLVQLLEELGRGALSPPPLSVFPIGRLHDAFHTMAQGAHIGKIVLRMGDPELRVRVRSDERRRLRGDGAYVITGGLGGLGLSAAEWLVEQGARDLVLMGRSGLTTPAQEDAVAKLEARGARVAIQRADVTDRAACEAALDRARQRSGALRGIIHTAALLDDALLEEQDRARLLRVLGPKAQGALHLDDLTRGDELELFVMYSSASALVGSPGQANYAAANAFLDAFAHLRRSQGRPALSIGWGPFYEVGLSAAQEKRGERMAGRGIRSISPTEGKKRLGMIIDLDVAYAASVDLDVQRWTEFYPHTARVPLFSELLSEAGVDRAEQGHAVVLGSLAEMAPEARRAMLLCLVREQVAEVLRLPLDRIEEETSLKSLGIDSLMGLELRNRLEASVGLKLPATLAWNYPHPSAIADLLVDKLKQREPARRVDAALLDTAIPTASPVPTAAPTPTVVEVAPPAPLEEGFEEILL